MCDVTLVTATMMGLSGAQSILGAEQQAQQAAAARPRQLRNI